LAKFSATMLSFTDVAAISKQYVYSWREG